MTNLRTLENRHAVNWFVGTEQVVWLYVGLYSRASLESQCDQSQYFCRTVEMPIFAEAVGSKCAKCQGSVNYCTLLINPSITLL